MHAWDEEIVIFFFSHQLAYDSLQTGKGSTKSFLVARIMGATQSSCPRSMAFCATIFFYNSLYLFLIQPSFMAKCVKCVVESSSLLRYFTANTSLKCPFHKNQKSDDVFTNGLRYHYACHITFFAPSTGLELDLFIH